jgi:filamentous hemagglutinin
MGFSRSGGSKTIGVKNIPFGFKGADEFQNFSKSINSGLNKAGIDDAQALFQGSAVTGKKFTTGEAFDVGRKSDFDMAISSPQLIQKAKEAGISLRSQGTRTGPLKAVDLEKLGLSDLSKQLSLEAGRPVNFMIFDGVKAATNKAPSILVPK